MVLKVFVMSVFGFFISLFIIKNNLLLKIGLMFNIL